MSTGLHQKKLPRLCEYWVKNCVLIPAVGKQNAIFTPDFTQPGNVFPILF